jgi:hypothetical protein
MRAAIVLAALAGLLAGCISAPEGATPEWADASGYPGLREVPRETIANTDADYWAAAEAELKEAGEAVRSHPRAQPASATESPEQFLEEARRELEETRLSHEPE